MTADAPRLETIRATQARLAPYLIETPVFTRPGPMVGPDLAGDTLVTCKMEFLQYTGSFKPRGAINNILSLDAAARARGVTAVSAGNHAIAVAYAARALDVSAKVVMHNKANPARIAKCRDFGAEVVLADDIMQAFDLVKGFEADEGRTFVHPFEGPETVAGTATVGAEFCDQAGAEAAKGGASGGRPMDAVIVAIGGGGLIAGVASAVKALLPTAMVYGVEPEGAPGMTQSIAKGAPVERVNVDTVADSMGAPLHMPGTVAICAELVDRIVLLDDDAMCQGVAWAFDHLKLALEPAGAAALAALQGPLAKELSGAHVGVLLCGSNIDLESYADFARRGGAFVG